MNNNNMVWSGVVLLAMFVIVIATVSITKKYEQDSITKTVMQNTTTTEFRDDYMSGCMEDGAGYSFCSCTYEKLIGVYGYDGLMKESIKFAQTNKLPEEMSSVVTQCLE